MAKLIANDNCWVGFSTASLSGSGATLGITAAQVAAATNLTPFLISLNASATGNTVPTPALDSLFETSISGTVQAQFQADFYRDDSTDTAWTTLPRAASGYIIVSRYGGSDVAPHLNRPIAADTVEIWPVVITSRTPSALASNTAQTFTITCSVPKEPNESATVAA